MAGRLRSALNSLLMPSALVTVRACLGPLPYLVSGLLVCSGAQQLPHHPQVSGLARSHQGSPPLRVAPLAVRARSQQHLQAQLARIVYWTFFILRRRCEAKRLTLL